MFFPETGLIRREGRRSGVLDVVTQRDQEVTRLLADWGRGDPVAADRLLPIAYDELRVLAHIVFEGQSPDQTIQPTALVHEAYLRLAGQSRPDWADRKHFFRVARKAQIVVLRFLAGLSIPETAKVLGVSRRTVELDWRVARAWLRKELRAMGCE